jgi:serine/threonine protein kinase
MESLTQIISKYQSGKYSGPRNINYFRPLEVIGSGGTAIVYLSVDALRTQVHFETENNRLKGKTPEQRADYLRKGLKVKPLALDKNVDTILSNPSLHKYIQLAAVKVLLQNRSRDPEILQRFQREWQSLQTFDSERVVKVFDGGHDKLTRADYFAMEVIDYIDPDLLLEASDQEKLEYFIQACHCIEELHEKSIVHRDIKEDNFLATRANENILVKIADLGFMKDYLNYISLTRTGCTIGTPHYMSPEQIKDFKHVDPRADIYSMGVILYHLFTGHYPFEQMEDEPPNTFVIRIVNDKPVPPSVHKITINPDIEEIIMKAICKDVNKRYIYVSQLREDIEKALHKLKAQNEKRSRRFRR